MERHLEIISRIQAIENSRQHRFFRTDIQSQKTVLGCPEELASRAGVFRGARLPPLPTRRRDEKRAPLKTPAWEAIEERDVSLFDSSASFELTFGSIYIIPAYEFHQD